MEHRDRSEDMLQESIMATGEQKEVLSCHFRGSGLPPAKIKPGRAFPLRMEQQADRGGRFLLSSVLNNGKSFLSVFDVLFFVQEAISYPLYSFGLKPQSLQ
jgi:hypothetical protein